MPINHTEIKTLDIYIPQYRGKYGTYYQGTRGRTGI